MIDGSGVCTACGAQAELDAEQKCPDCAPSSESADDSAMPMDDSEEDAE